MPPATDPASAARSEMIRLLYRQSVHAVPSVLVTSVLWGALVWDAADHVRLAVWAAFVVLSFVARASLFSLWFRRRPEGPDALAWERPYVATLIASSIVFGVGMTLVVPRGEPALEFATFLVLVGMTGAALPAYGVLVRTTQALVLLMNVPMIVSFLLQDDHLHRVVAVAGIWFMVTVFRAVHVNSDAVLRNFTLMQELRIAKQQAEELAQSDVLTLLRNRRAFSVLASESLARTRAQGGRASLLVIDVDHFKALNDAHGHATGDAVLLHVASAMLEHAPRADLCGRLGGDEFAMLLPGVTADEAARVAENVRTSLARHVAGLGLEHPLGVSIGVAERGETLEALLHAADLAMYGAKRSGRDRVGMVG